MCIAKNVKMHPQKIMYGLQSCLFGTSCVLYVHMLLRALTLSALLKVSHFKDRCQVLSRHSWGLLGAWKRVKETPQTGLSVLFEHIILLKCFNR